MEEHKGLCRDMTTQVSLVMATLLPWIHMGVGNMWRKTMGVQGGQQGHFVTLPVQDVIIGKSCGNNSCSF